MKVLNDIELKALLTKLKSKFALANHTHTGYAASTHSHDVVSTTAAGFVPKGGGTTTKFLRDDSTWAVPVTIDWDFDDSSGNPVANSVIEAALSNKANKTLATTSANGLMSAADKKAINNWQTILQGGGNTEIHLIDSVGVDVYIETPTTIYLNAGRSIQATADLHVEGKVTSDASDYAKCYEWLDGNTGNEDRRGLFVSLEGEKIRYANAEDDFILGIVSAAPGFVENAYESEWHGKYLKDIYGKHITKAVEVPESTDAEGNIIPSYIKTEYVINPDYNEDEEYIPRSKRPEWTYVGLTGELVARDDGTCEVNGYCRPKEGGIATKSDTGYRVIARLDESHIKVLIK